MAEHKEGIYSSFMRRLLVALGLATFTAAAIPQNASSAELMEQSVASVGNYRVGAFAGAFIPNRASWNGSGTINALPFAASGHISLNTGSAVSGLVGYAFNSYLNVDLALGRVASNFEKFDGTVSIAGLGSLSGSMPLSGRIHTTAGFVNFLITPVGTDGRLTPYFGIGPGFANSTARLQSFSVGPAILPINSTSSETDPAADVVLGFDVKMTPQLEIGLAYEYVWIDAKHLGSGSGIQANAGHVSGHILGLVLEYRFKGPAS